MENLIAMQQHIEALRKEVASKDILLKATEGELFRSHSTLFWVIVGNTIGVVLATSISWVWAFASFSSDLESKDIQIAQERERTADAEERVHNVIEAWNNTSKELEQCKSH